MSHVPINSSRAQTLPPWSRVLQNLRVAKMIKKFSKFYETLEMACHWIIS
jgi:hypothetical protein